MSRRKARQRISYVLPLANSPGGHRLGVNGLAIDGDNSILYSGGRDGVICAWDINAPSPATVDGKPTSPKRRSSFRKQIQAHTHWVNDILLAQSNTALVSASSDITVKVWRPNAADEQAPSTIGLHTDYVKCLASPDTHSDWVASGGLDHKIFLWDLNGAGEKLQIDAGKEEGNAKGSVYALSARGSMIASGGPDSILRLWDARSGKRITKLVGHTDNLRDILIGQGGDTIMTASSDQTIKVWSMAAGRCMHTLTMHNDSVWSLYSDHPQLSIFYSSDRSGIIAKTDVRLGFSLDEGVSIAVAHENEGVGKLLVSDGDIWTATSRSSINRWKDVDINAQLEEPLMSRHMRGSSIASRSKISPSAVPEERTSTAPAAKSVKIPSSSLLKTSNSVSAKTRDMDGSVVTINARKQSDVALNIDLDAPVVPLYDLPEETIEGQNGLIKHVILNDRRRVLTLDSAGEVLLWDLIKCLPVQSFGKRHLEDVAPEVNTTESVANWCAVDTRTGRLAVILEENYCFDGEVYADEIENDAGIEFKEDQRINLGKWVLRYLFAGLIDEEIRRDELWRNQIQSMPQTQNRPRKGLHLGSLPPNQMATWQRSLEDDSAITPRVANNYGIMTPGLTIGVATPGMATITNVVTSAGAGPVTSGTVDESAERRGIANGRTSADYFSSKPPPATTSVPTEEKATGNGNETQPETAQSPTEPEKDAKSGSLFTKKFRMNFPKLGRSTNEAKPAIVDDKSEESDKSSDKDDKVVDDNFQGVVQKLRHEYEDVFSAGTSELPLTGIVPSLPAETPVLKPPPLTTIIIQEDRPDSGGVADLWKGTVNTVGQEADVVEKAAPMWLGELLLRNQLPFKDQAKVSFILQPWQDLLPALASPDGNARLNANRMLRAKKIASYITDRIDPTSHAEGADAMKPEEYLELYCQDKLIAPNMTLATIRAHVWKTGGDVLLYYKSNGRKPAFDRRHVDVREKAAAAAAAAAQDDGTTSERTNGFSHALLPARLA